MKSKQKLKDIKEVKVYIDIKLTCEEQNAQKKMRKFAVKEKSEVKKVRVGFIKL